MNPSPEPLKSTRHRRSPSPSSTLTETSRQLSGMMSPLLAWTCSSSLCSWQAISGSCAPAPLTPRRKQSEPCRNDAQHVCLRCLVGEPTFQGRERSAGWAVLRARQASGLELDIPVKVIHPAFVQEVRREQPAVVVEVLYARVEGFLARPTFWRRPASRRPSSDCRANRRRRRFPQVVAPPQRRGIT